MVTRALPPEAGAWWAPRLAEQEAVLAELAAVAPVLSVAESATGPVAADDVAALAPDLPAPPEPVSRPAPERVAEGWRLVLPLPFAEHGAVELTRWGDDLVLTAARSRRSVRLDSLLRRCVVTGGTLADAGTAAARLEVGFVPDPQQWPSDLLDSHQRADGGDSAAEPTAAEEDS